RPGRDMPELFAEGQKPEERWRRRLPDGRAVVLGRASGDWSVPWDQWISQAHAELRWDRGALEVRRLPGARNPIWSRGREADAFQPSDGEKSLIGPTSSLLRDETDQTRTEPHQIVESRTVSAGDLKKIAFRDAPHHLDVLSRLPEVIASAADRSELF